MVAQAMKRFLSLGAGVQSTTVALLATVGEIPTFDCAIFADTQSEPAAVYRHLEWLTSVVNFPVQIVTAGSLKQEIYDAIDGKKGAWGRPPFYLTNPDGSKGMTNRQCTWDFKLKPIYRELRAQLGIARGSQGPREVVVEQNLGISLDEAHRMRDAQFRWVKHVYPLIEMKMSRVECLAWLERRGFPRPPKSSCTFCPYHSDAQWLDLKKNHPEAWHEAVDLDDRIRAGVKGVKGTPFLHQTLIPLRDVTFGHENQIDLFGNECGGVCGV